MKKNKNIKWIITITLLAFIISFIFSLISESTIPKVSLPISIIILILFIVLGVIFDMVGVAVTASNEEPLHAMSSKKIKGAKKAVNFKKNAAKVSSFCNDVIGDICGIISGSAGVTIALNLANKFNIDAFWMSLLITALIASLTIGGKAICKNIAIKNSHNIVHMAAKVLSIYQKNK